MMERIMTNQGMNMLQRFKKEDKRRLSKMNKTVNHKGFDITCLNCGGGDGNTITSDALAEDVMVVVIKCNLCENEDVLEVSE